MRHALTILLLLASTAWGQNVIGKSQTLGRVDPNSKMVNTIYTNCVLWMPFTYAEDIATNYYDLSTSVNNGAATNANTNPSVSDGAATLDGVDDYIKTSTANTMNGYTSVTISAWIRPTSFSAYSGIIVAREDGGNMSGILLGGTPANTTLALYLKTSAGLAYIDPLTTGIIPSNSWSMVVMTWSTNTGAIGCWVNATNKTIAGTAKPGATIAQAVAFELGRDSTFKNLGGKMDDCLVFNRELTALEITNLYNATKNPNPARP